MWLGVAAAIAGLAGLVTENPALGLLAGAAGLAAALVVNQANTALAAERDQAVERAEKLEAEAKEAAAALAELEEKQAAEAEEPVDLGAAEAEALVDPVTGLHGERFFEVTLENRVAAARRHLRPVAVVLLEVARGVADGEPVPVDPATLSGHVTRTLREADLACHLGDARFGLVLEDTPENGAVWTVERVRRALTAEHQGLTLWAGVACYPAHAFEAPELLARATSALEAAREWRQDRIEVATPTEV
jgi:GGDEF domain-containing protein